MRFKKGISLEVREEITRTFPTIESVYNLYGREAVITCGDNGNHSRYSRHYLGLAIDLRTRFFNKTTIKKVARDLRKMLGKDYLVLVHKTHIHLAYKPTR